ncbi:MAG: hypothetical protein IKM40_04010, partial [Clostridia bacterium]|nr:hypothetical protein [Clostridia bacterium]
MKNIFIKICITALIISTCILPSIIIFAHDSMLNISYDPCNPKTTSNNNYYFEVIKEDNEEELWYSLEDEFCEHIGEDIETIKYYFFDSNPSTGYTWDTDFSTTIATEIKEAYATSMKQWNNVHYYTYDENGTRVSNKVIHIEEGTAEDCNIRIYPAEIDAYASVGPSLNINDADYSEEIEYVNGTHHYHHEKWVMYVDVSSFYGQEDSEIVLARTGAHEVGHILGLLDIDLQCDFEVNDRHHQECLMGYGTNAATHPTYKDIAGVSITRGFHTDEDHSWMLRTNTDGTQDVICSQCNGVRYDVTLTDGQYEGKDVNIYQSCIHHGGTNQEMLLVASDGERYFYKCQYCRYIATYEKDNATQLSSTGTNVNITMTVPANSEIYYKVIVYDTYAYNLKSSNSLIDISVCDSGLSVINSNLTNASTSDGTEVTLEDDNTYYLKIENNSNISQTVTIDIVGPHVHSFDYWVYQDLTRHRSLCECGARGDSVAFHWFRTSEDNPELMICSGCGFTK